MLLFVFILSTLLIKAGNLGEPHILKQDNPGSFAEWFSQNLDHFNPNDKRTWPQRYFVNSQNSNDLRNIAFLVINEEGEASSAMIDNGALIYYARQFQAICFLLEHRYYGESHPTNDMSIENLEYLSSQQALADSAFFIKSMNKEYNLSPHVKWIAFGYSYAGSLAAWLRQLYPDLVHGAVSSSAPLLAKLNFVVPTLKPIKPLPSFTTLSPEFLTENPDEQFATVRGDGGKDYGGSFTPAPKPVTEEEPVTQIVPQTLRPAFKAPVGTVPPSTPKPPPVEGCALPLNPVQESETVVGYRFGTQKVSRLEFNLPRGKYKKSFDFRFDFKTKENEGILFYVSDRNHRHYAALYLMNGHVIFTFKGDSAVVIKSTNTYDDDNWHLVEFNRDASNGKLVIDQIDVNAGTTPQKTLALDLHVPFYIGGLNADVYNQVQSNLNTTMSFNGCIRSISMNNRLLEQPQEYGVMSCSDSVEVGTFFGGDDQTYVKMKEKFMVGEMFNIKMDIKPRVDSGLLVAAHGRKDYYVLELHNGQLKLTVENGRGPITAVFQPKNRYHLCDGQWHNIQAVKSKNVVTLSVDNYFTDSRIGSKQSISTNTGSALFLGGHRFIMRVRGIVSRAPYVGCVKNVEINNEPIQLAPNMVYGNITIGFCPTN